MACEVPRGLTTAQLPASPGTNGLLSMPLKNKVRSTLGSHIPRSLCLEWSSPTSVHSPSYFISLDPLHFLISVQMSLSQGSLFWIPELNEVSLLYSFIGPCYFLSMNDSNCNYTFTCVIWLIPIFSTVTSMKVGLWPLFPQDLVHGRFHRYLLSEWTNK